MHALIETDWKIRGDGGVVTMETKFGWMEMWNHFIGGGAGVGGAHVSLTLPAELQRRPRAASLGAYMFPMCWSDI